MIILLLLALITPPPPAPSTYVTDAVNVIGDDREHALNERLAQYERETTNQLMVYVDRRIPEGTTLEEMSTAALNAWVVKENGVILFLFIDDRASRIEVGDGLTQRLTDAHAKRILVSLRPALRAGDYTTAVEEGVDAITRTIAGVRRAPPPNRAPVEAATQAWDSDVISLVGLIVLVFGIAWLILAIRDRSILPTAFSGLSDRTSQPRWSSESDSSPSWSSSSSSSRSSSSSSSSSGSGGGSSGGHGASDRW